MGQYYHAVNLDRLQYVDPHHYGNGAKLMEHSWLFNGFVSLVTDLLKPGGDWHRTRMVWAGDYMDEGLYMDALGNDAAGARTLYDCCSEREHAGGIIANIRPVGKDGPVAKFIVNHTAGLLVDLAALPPDGDGWCIHPLPLLTCSGNGRGGGDFYGDNDFVGSWAADMISVEYQRPQGYSEIKPDFLEKVAA